MQQLSGQDASFIYSELPHAPTHVTSIGIYDQATAPDGLVTFKGVLAYLEARLHLAHAFRQKVVRVPADIDHPWWVEDAEFDVEYHVRHLALPRPVMEGLDDIEGVPAGAFAIVVKVHHAAIDGKSGMEMITAMHTQEPDLTDPPPPAVPWSGERDPSWWDLSTRAGVNALTVPGRSTRLAGRLVPGVGRALQVQRRQTDGQLTGLAPATRFNGPISGHRVLDARFYDFDDLKPMRHAVPVGNQVSAMLVSLATDIDDPVERLAAVHASTTASKELTEAIGARSLTDLSQLAPGALVPAHYATCIDQTFEALADAT